MKISKLIEVLKERKNKHGDVEVKVTWEGITKWIESSNIYMGKENKLLIDADSNFYKPDFALDPNEGEEEE